MDSSYITYFHREILVDLVHNKPTSGFKLLEHKILDLEDGPGIVNSVVFSFMGKEYHGIYLDPDLLGKGEPTDIPCLPAVPDEEELAKRLRKSHLV